MSKTKANLKPSINQFPRELEFYFKNLSSYKII